MPKTSTKAAPKTKRSSTTTKKATTKTTRTRKAASTAEPAEVVVMQSFRPAKQGAFLTLQITRQTLYWAIIAVLVVGLAAWVLYLQMQIIDIYDSIERNELLNA